MSLSDIVKQATWKGSNNPTSVEDLFSVSQGTGDVSNTHLPSDLTIGEDKKEDTVIVTFINDIFLNAMRMNASDIHIEPRERDILVRFRVDGSFVQYKKVNVDKKDAIIARIKIMSYLRIDEHRLPQDGKIHYKLYGGKTVDMRISVLPTIYGEKCVIRILKKDDRPPELKDLGILPYNMIKVKKHLKDAYGMILAVGPTGSWKSTTLFSLLSQYNSQDNNITTLEDPVEYRISGVNHTQINPAINFSFAKWLRSILRQDPDIIMVWEIRDDETAKLSVEASITWHTVFSTLHTNSATHTLQRLVNLGIDPLLISSSLRMIISQRLARKLCPCCKIHYKPEEKIAKYITGRVGKFLKIQEWFLLYKANPKGCDKCGGTGYKWRIGLYEVLEMTEKMEQLMMENASSTKLEVQAVWDGMVPIKDDALLKVVLWDTSLEEVLAVLGT